MLLRRCFYLIDLKFANLKNFHFISLSMFFDEKMSLLLTTVFTMSLNDMNYETIINLSLNHLIFWWFNRNCSQTTNFHFFSIFVIWSWFFVRNHFNSFNHCLFVNCCFVVQSFSFLSQKFSSTSQKFSSTSQKFSSSFEIWLFFRVFAFQMTKKIRYFMKSLYSTSSLFSTRFIFVILLIFVARFFWVDKCKFFQIHR